MDVPIAMCHTHSTWCHDVAGPKVKCRQMWGKRECRNQCKYVNSIDIVQSNKKAMA